MLYPEKNTNIGHMLRKQFVNSYFFGNIRHSNKTKKQQQNKKTTTKQKNNNKTKKNMTSDE